MNTNKKYIVFDFDGTLADSRLLLADVYNRYLSKRYGGRQVTAEEIEQLRGMSFLGKIRYLHVSPIKIPLFIKAARREIGRRIERLTLFNGIENVLSELKSLGYILAVVSSNRGRNIERFLEVKKIHTIDHISCDRGASLFVKNATIKRFLKKHDAPPAQVIYVGDEVRDIVASRKAGIRIISVTWGFDSPESLEVKKPDYIARTPEDIITGVSILFA
jgi:phosphoglycolate phosphatase